MIGPDRWRVVVNAGRDHTHLVWVRPDGEAYVAMSSDGARCHGRTPRLAVVALAARKMWEIVEIRGPGEATTVEQVERVTAVACAEIADG